MKLCLQFCVLAVVMLFSGCVSAGESVVARSSVDRPSWVEGDVREEPQKFVQVVYKKSDVYRLELGIKQVQAAALVAAPKLLRERVLRDINRAADIAVGVPVAKSLDSEIVRIVALSAPESDAPDALIARTYHEEIQRESNTGVRISYDVSVLVSVPRHDYELHMLAAMQRMLASDNESIRKVGTQIKAQFTAENSSQN